MDEKITANIRRSYDIVASEYARHLYDELRHKPRDRELLDRFAERVGGRGEVCDMGCGPGHVARHLSDAGLPVFGVDLSPRMLEEAQARNPGIRFQEGNMLSLDIPSGTLAGIVAFYAIVNIPKASLPTVFREMSRVLRPGGLLLIAFHVGDDVVTVGELWEKPIAMDFLFFQPAEIRRLLESAGFVIAEVIEREPYPEVEYQSRRAYVLASKPDSR